MEVRPYTNNDKAAILRIFHSNCPKYFDASEEPGLIDFLDNYTDENYLVALEDGEVIGCGGHYTKGDKHAIAWAMFQHGSIGPRRLLKVAQWFYGEMEKRMLAHGQRFDVYINTTQLMVSLFSRFGFKAYETIPDGFGKGLDEVKMVKQF
ncbi:GNAT family N-acetyltransferase [Parendozoicomonas haliclonae]|uniref:N-acetyltransferase domain-containing protein n=1 Tax=Parendozoicomonas haliclonae TaxID=1960125 RepID=A0A1X7AMD0_9GAMM|nr:GNAT family N-acetyltransferase [Parendozoicomonas haliclonae]SMA49427.1 hypothetical protein EHSB41UT_03250 [Parendozoicomonas haliclonae]